MKRLLAFLLILATACDRQSNVGAHSVRDSAGVEIVESSRPLWDSTTRGRVSVEPVLTIGAVQGDAPYLFHGILGVRRLSDGRLVVANQGTSELRFFDSTGRHLHTVGGEGDGPGEFRFMSLFGTRAGDTIVVSDVRGLSILDPEGRFVRLIQPRSAGGDAIVPTPLFVGQLDDGTLLAMGGRRSPDPAPGQRVRDTLEFWRALPDGTLGDKLAELPGYETLPFEMGPGRVMLRRAPFFAYPAWSAKGNRIYLTGGVEPEVRVWGPDGMLRRVVRWSPASLTLTSDDVSRYREHMLAAVTDPARKQQQERWLAEVRLPSRVPATGEVAAILVDGDGAMWVQAYRMPWDASPEWMVFSSEGAWLGFMAIPERLTPHHVGPDFVLGAWRDESGVEYVHLYRVTTATR